MAILLNKVSVDNNGSTYKIEFNDYRVGTVVVPNALREPAVYDASTWISHDMATNIANDISINFDKNVTVNHRNKTFSIDRYNIKPVSYRPITKEATKVPHVDFNPNWVRCYDGPKYYGKMAEFDFNGAIGLKVHFKKRLSVAEIAQKVWDFSQNYPIVHIITNDLPSGCDIIYGMTMQTIEQCIINSLEKGK